MDEVTSVKHVLDTKFKIKDLGSLKYFLGLEIARSKYGILMNQSKYALEILDDNGLLGSKPTPTPFNPSIILQAIQGKLFSYAVGYRWLVGKLMYLTITLPDIAYFVQ